MESRRFAALTRALVVAGSRRGLLGAISSLPFVGGLAALLGEQEVDARGRRHRRRVKRHKHGKGRRRQHHKGQHKHKKKRKCHGDVCPSGCPFTSVQEAIDAAEPGDTITLCAGAYPENLAIGTDLTIVGAGADATTLQGDGTASVVDIASGVTVAIRNLTITGGNSFNGGGIFNDGTLTLSGVTVSGNRAGGNGGSGIFNALGGTLSLTDCTVTDNHSDVDGGGITNGGTLTLSGVTISENTAGGTGGGIYNVGAVTLTDSSVTDNEAGAIGGGIFNGSGTVTLEAGASVTDNEAGNDGGGIYNTGIAGGGTSTCTGDSDVSGNTPNDCVAVDGGSCDAC